jgi:hypothetical protein
LQLIVLQSLKKRLDKNRGDGKFSAVPAMPFSYALFDTMDYRLRQAKATMPSKPAARSAMVPGSGTAVIVVVLVPAS